MGPYSLQFAVILLSQLIPNAILWPNHDISTLKLLQVVHRHGDRNIEEHRFPNDPFKNYSQYWPEGEGQLTNQGKYRMYTIGQFIRESYQSYLGSEFSPREVYVRSSAKPRCLESAQLVASGAYPPNNTVWQWANDTLASIWQPVPIESFIPMDDDKVLRNDAPCPAAEEAEQRIYHSKKVQNFLNTERPFITQLEAYMGRNFRDIEDMSDFWDTYHIESDRGYRWSDKGVFNQTFQNLTLLKSTQIATYFWNVRYNDTLIQRTKAGPLLEELSNNFKASIAGNVTQKVMFYSTHDSKIAVFMQLLGIFNGQLYPFGSTLFFELHQKPNTDSHFVRIYFLNETLPAMNPYLLPLPGCQQLSDCPSDRFFTLSGQLIPEDWNSECGIRGGDIFTSLNITLIVMNAIFVLVLILILSLICCRSRRQVDYQALE